MPLKDLKNIGNFLETKMGYINRFIDLFISLVTKKEDNRFTLNKFL